MKFINKLIIFTIFLTISNLCLSDDKIVYLDFDKVLEKSKAGASLLKNLNKLDEENLINIKKMADQLKQDEKKILSQKNILTKEEFEKKVKLFKDEVNNYKKTRQLVIDDTSKIRARNRNRFLILTNKILSKYAIENSIDLVLPKNSILIGKKDLDISDKIITLINLDSKDFDIK
tara:strand:- start:499 stop:1023 length:525 start_codon:yes stop_codon:yes gene_type:complete